MAETRRGLLRQAAEAGAGGLALAALGGCGGSGAAPAPAGRPVTVRYHSGIPETHPSGAARLALLEEFNQTNPQRITVDLTEARGATDAAKATALAAAGTPPQLLYTPHYAVAEFLAGGMTVDVDAELRGDREWARLRADLFPAMLESSTWGGRVAGIPLDTNNQAVIYNTGLLAQAGVAPPQPGWTWDEFRETARRFVRPDVVPLSMGWAATWLHWLGTTGARPITPDARRITADTPELLAVVELYLDLLKQGILRTVPDGQGRPGPLFETYQLARNDTVFEVQGPYRLPTLEQQGAPPCLTVPVPVHPVRRRLAAANGGWSLVLFKNGPAAARQAAAQAGLWLSGPDAQARFCVRSRNLPVSRAALEAPVFRAAARANPAFGGFADLAPYGWRWPALPSYAAISKVLDDSIAAVLRDEIAPRAGLARAQQAAQALLDEDLRRLPG